MTYKLFICDCTSLNAALAQGAQTVNARRTVRPGFGFRASGLSACLRRRGYEVLGTEPTDESYNPDYDLAAAQGTLIHERLQQWLRESGLVYDYPGHGLAIELPLSVCCPAEERPLLERLQFSGHIDAVLDVRGALAVLDIKTVASKYLAGEDFGEEYPWLAGRLQGYAIQVHAYMRFCGAPDGRRAEQAYILMVSRDDTSIRRLYQVPWQPEVFAGEMERLEAAHAAVSAGKLPAAEPARGPCVFCWFRTRCEEERE